MSLIPVHDLRAYLAGHWRIARRIDDQSRDKTGEMSGSASFRDDGPDLIYAETGRLTLGAHTGDAVQSYRYAFPEPGRAPGRAEVRFMDGRDFHHLDLGSGFCEVTHLCGEDVYAGRIEARGPDAWRVRWEITGPRKKMNIETDFSRE